MSALDEYRVMWKDDPPETREAESVVEYADAAIAEMEARNEVQRVHLEELIATLAERDKTGATDCARIAELEAKVEHDEGNLDGLEHALMRANRRYTKAEAALAARDRMLLEAWKLRGESSSFEAFLDSLRTRAEEGN